jgi:Ca2+-binding EF-hand superfamily protein
MRQQFNQLDQNGDQKIEQSEFINVYIKVNPRMSREAAVKEAVRLFKVADTDKNGSISFAEWCAAGINLEHYKPEKSLQEILSRAITNKLRS